MTAKRVFGTFEQHLGFEDDPPELVAGACLIGGLPDQAHLPLPLARLRLLHPRLVQ